MLKDNLGCRERIAKGPAGAVDDGKKKGKKGGKGGKGAAAEILDGTNIKANMYILYNKDKLSISNTFEREIQRYSTEDRLLRTERKSWLRGIRRDSERK